MELTFFADHCVPYSVIRSLRDAGYEVLILKEYIRLFQDAWISLPPILTRSSILVN